MAVIGAKGNFGGPGGAFEEGRRKEIVCNEVKIIREVIRKMSRAGAEMCQPYASFPLTLVVR